MSAQAPTITDVTPSSLHASETGSIRVRGAALDRITSVTLGGVTQTIQQRSASEIVFAKTASDPGHLPLQLSGSAGSVDASFTATPAIDATPGRIGGSLLLTMEPGAAGPFVLYLGFGALTAPLRLPQIQFGLLLDPALGLQALEAGLTSTSSPVSFAWAVPADPTLAGAELHFQAWQQEGLGPNPISSFSNLATADIDHAWSARAPLPFARSGVAAVELDGRILAIGGRSSTSSSSAVDEYDPATDTWSALPPMITARSRPVAGELGGRVSVVSGSGPGSAASAHESYDPISNAWTVRAPIPTPRWNAGAAVLDGKLHVIGGQAPATGAVLGAHEVYDPATNTWSSRAPLATPRQGLGIAPWNGKIYAIGGADSTASAFFANVDEYDPTTNAWVAKAPMAMPRSGFGCVASNDRIYAIGGAGAGASALDRTDEYDPLSNTWTTQAPMPTPRRELGAVAFDDRLLGIGGSSASSSPLPTVEEFRPAPSAASTNGWTEFVPAPGARIVHVSATGNDAANGSELQPRRTLAGGYALLRDGYADWLLLRRGDSFALDTAFLWDKSGPPSGAGWMRLGAYGDEQLPRPVLLSRGGYLSISPGYQSAQPIQRLAITDVYLHAADRIANSATTTLNLNGIQLVAIQWQGTGWPFSDILVENCRLSGFTSAFVSSSDVTNLTIRRCIFDTIFGAQTTHAGGVLGGATNWLLEENVFYRIMSPDIPGVGANAYSPFSHSVYVTTEASNVVTRRNICIKCSDGPMQRAGGVHQQNVSVECNIAGNVGQAWGVTPVAGGVQALVQENLGLNTLGGSFFLGNIRSGSVRTNLLLEDLDGQGATNLSLVSRNASGSGINIGVHDTDFLSNVVSGSIQWNPADTASYSGLTFAGNRTNTGPTATRIADYLRSVGWTGSTVDDWAQQLVQRDKSNFSAHHSALSVINFYRARYGLPPLR